jgi:hypothetical protein
MGVAAYNRGTKALCDQLDREERDRRTVRMVECGGRMRDGTGKLYGRCTACGGIDYELYEGDRCRRLVPRD